MPNLSDFSVIQALLRRYGMQTSKALGQNFLIQPDVCPRMAQSCGADSDVGVLEIGPGLGVLTVELAQVAKKVVTVELDKRLLPVLTETLAGQENIAVIFGDVLQLDLHTLLAKEFPDMPVVICANLPYYITSPILMRLLESRLPVESITVMVQKEAAERLCAPVGSRQAGAVTVAVQYYAQAQQLFSVPAEAFYPAPKVDSAVIRLNVRTKAPVQVRDEVQFFRTVKAAFGQRRKTIGNALTAGLARPKQEVLAALEQAGISANARAEQLTMQEFARLSDALLL